MTSTPVSVSAMDEELGTIPYQPNSSKRRRHKSSRNQIEGLERAFQLDSKPCREIQDQLAIELGMSIRSIQIWFQNRRAKARSAGVILPPRPLHWKTPMMAQVASTDPIMEEDLQSDSISLESENPTDLVVRHDNYKQPTLTEKLIPSVIEMRNYSRKRRLEDIFSISNLVEPIVVYSSPVSVPKQYPITSEEPSLLTLEGHHSLGSKKPINNQLRGHYFSDQKDFDYKNLSPNNPDRPRYYHYVPSYDTPSSSTRASSVDPGYHPPPPSISSTLSRNTSRSPSPHLFPFDNLVNLLVKKLPQSPKIFDNEPPQPTTLKPTIVTLPAVNRKKLRKPKSDTKVKRQRKPKLKGDAASVTNSSLNTATPRDKSPILSPKVANPLQ